MPIDLGRISIAEVIIHDVQLPPAPLALSDVVSVINNDLRNYIAERLRRSVQRGFDVERDPATASITPVLVEDMIAGRVPLVPASRELATHLYGIQRRPYRPGLLAVCTANVEGRPGVALLKIERARGMRAEPTTDPQGRRTFALDVIRSLLFTDNTQVFKAAVFRVFRRALDGKVSDEQAGERERDVADFFLRTFLGCRLATAPDIATRAFFDSAESYINEEVADPVQKTTYELALITELNSQRQVIDPPGFARAYLRVEDRQPFLRHLQERGVGAEPTVKSLDLVTAILKRVQMDFHSGVKVLAPPHLLDPGGTVTVENAQGGLTRVSILDELRRMRSAG